MTTASSFAKLTSAGPDERAQRLMQLLGADEATRTAR